ncbi:MAG: NAD(P)-binding domain-containing protein [Rhodococcus sp. (in: high G+C Gram-positive bacteria)]|uniref:NAD(P)-dependent oxidoreductase n=1 Tax=unclassified Rhodococcus (in: high G+C Gram-positive bacteria) TaxID=192944 RepID=UPI000AAB49F3|nr:MULTISPECIES: NAD(P)-binding domain-containing protein [unclassified Rhodococcus (in: high G+C Gram-positive bacteria)]RMB78569.1 NAD(P)-dependent oxidoreductase [Rhodococcus sp. SBT000017]
MGQEHRAPVTVIGLGSMGSAIAQSFLDKGHSTTVWNRSPQRADQLVAQGAVLATTVSEAVAASDLVIICVLDYRAMHEILSSTGPASPGRAIVNLTSGTPDEARETARWARERGSDYLDGAIMATPSMIGSEHTLIFYGGPKSIYDTHGATLSSIAGASTYLSEDAGLPSLYDVSLLGMMWTTWTGFMHSVALIGTENVTASAFLPYAEMWFEHVISPEVANIARQVDEGQYTDDDSTLGMQIAAIDHLVDASQAQGVDSALPELLKRRAAEAIERGYAGDGFTALYEVLRKPTADRSI